MPPASQLADSFLRSGKVRDLYAVGDDRLLLVASDRLSAFDVVLPTPIPDKGRVLTGLSRFWFARTADLVPNHLVGVAPEEIRGFALYVPEGMDFSCPRPLATTCAATRTRAWR